MMSEKWMDVRKLHTLYSPAVEHRQIDVISCTTQLQISNRMQTDLMIYIIPASSVGGHQIAASIYV